MASRRRCLQALALTRQAANLALNNPSSISFPNPHLNSNLSPTFLPIFTQSLSRSLPQWHHPRFFSSSGKEDDRASKDDSGVEEDEDEDDYDDDEVDYESESGEDESGLRSGGKRVYTPEEKEAEAANIGYKVVGPLTKGDDVFKPYEPVFAVVQIGSHQFKVSIGDAIFTERLKFCEVNDKLTLNKVLLLGSPSQTIIGRPIVPDAGVHAVVEEHALDAKVLIFKKKRRKNYRRTKGHRQELTKLRITDIQGIEKPENVPASKPSKAAKKEQEKVAATA
ncbi:hypothetical protein HN51_037242 [Arachis hypogaea]|uniref:Large ribosomal subunit protein bL21m n=1 Tax=Arachis hypogaea TaxID=3818 RepID=A0A444ZX36_ARAHY|nr:50S ribosomal protein L21, mitochondrial [Arachis ipaensis]XP_025638249.1 50S ribosomal protein L21, mitochondrial [Arachis hypogaea]QHO02776.1 50S ribosomal protein [Arachis hypogaea]RYR18592.1 hypothetical protein Ahy_B03g063217 [Arachis hypogaea]